MRTGFVRFILSAAACLLTLGVSWTAPQPQKKARRQNLDDMTNVLSIQHLPDGTVLRKRSFNHAVPWDEYIAAVAAETPGMAPSSTFDEATSEATTQCLPAPTNDYDADGFTLATTPADGPPLLFGEFIADRPRITAEFRSTIEPSIVVLYSGDTNYTIETETFQKQDLVETTTASDTLEFKSTFNSPGGIKLNFGFAGLKPTFKVSDFSLGYEFEKKRTYTWSRVKTRTTEDRWSVMRNRKEQGTVSFAADAGKVSGDVIIKNVSDYSLLMRLSSVRIAVVAYSPATGARDVIGQIEITSSFDLNWGENNNFYWLPLVIEHLNTADMMDKLAEGWVFDFEVASPPTAVDRTTNNDVGALISTINQNNARISIHYGDTTTRQFGQVSVYQPGSPNGCLTVKDMLTTFVGASNVEFDRMPDGTLIVKRINHRTNRFADRDFDSLTPDEQNQYGRWVVGFNFFNSPLTQLDLETTALRPEDKVFFYFVTASDYRESSRPEDFNLVSTVANDGSYPASAVAAPGVSTNDLVEITVRNTFQIESAYTQPAGTVAGCGVMMYNSTYHGHRVTTDSLNDSTPIPDADYYGVQVKFGGMPWLSIAAIMAEPTAKAQMTSFRGFPYYDYTLQFRASPALLGSYPTRNLQVQTVKPRQSFYPVGYEGTDIGNHHRTCYHTEIGGFFRSAATVKVWYKLDNVDIDLDGFYTQNRTGLDFDDGNDRRFPFAPEYLDGVDNDNKNGVDDNPLICPDSLQSYQSGTCTLNNRMGWYGPSP
ncbi:MAG TPA: hypothetical protein VFE84_02815, partial [Patescibacteria group bacterium]|nr:hypothetical protein [Patescibacteria group bacterium]